MLFGHIFAPPPKQKNIHPCIIDYKKGTISQMLGELGTKEETLDYEHQKRNKRTIK